MSEIWLPGDSDFALAMRGWPTSGREQPRTPFVVNEADHFAKSLVVAIEAATNTPYDIVTGEHAAFATPFDRIGSDVGMVHNCNVSSSSGIQFGVTAGDSKVADALSGATEYTLEFLFRPTSTNQHTMGCWVSPNAWLMQNNGANLVWVAADSSGARRRWDASSIFTLNTWNHVILSWQGLADKAAVVNGVDKTSSLSPVSTLATALPADLPYLRIGPNTGGTPNFQIAYLRIFGRGLSLDECLELSRRPPYEMFEPADKSPYLISVPTGGGVPTLSLPGVTGVQATQVTPQVTLTF